MLDDLNVIAQRDPSGALDVAANEWQQVAYEAIVVHGDHDGRAVTNVVVAGMGGSALAALLAKAWLQQETDLYIEVVRTYTLPKYVNASTLVICSSYSGNTEETLACLEQAKQSGAQRAILTSGGTLQKISDTENIAAVVMPAKLQPRMAVFYNLRALVQMLVHFNVVDRKYYEQIAEHESWLEDETAGWLKEVSVDKNIAKQLALFAAGKTAVFYAGHLMAPVAYKWKISWNENAKNVSFWNEYPEFNHNEFMGWASHPVEKPFAVFDLVSGFEHARIQKRFTVSDKLLSGRRPKAHVIHLQGDTPLAQMLWGSVLADFVSIYLAILNGVDPTPVDLIEKLKKELTA